MSERLYLLDVNVLIALVDAEHVHHQFVLDWFDSASVKQQGWAVCALTESALVRIFSGPGYPSTTIDEAFEVLEAMQQFAGYHYWPIADSLLSVTAAFRDRVFGHKQITDAFLLGLAVKHHGVLVTLDKGVKYMAGPQYQKHVRLLEPGQN
ncbi:MAG TPA: TA system VapC family ribonuclease toxin [Edaphobacter sp.]